MKARPLSMLFDLLQYRVDVYEDFCARSVLSRLKCTVRDDEEDKEYWM